MATIKSFTSLEQSKKLAKILPLDSADMCFNTRNNMPPLMTSYSRFNEFFNMEPTPAFLIPCWSLAALLSVLPNKIVSHETAFEGEDAECINDTYNKRVEPTEDGRYMCCYVGNGCIYECVAGNPVDACCDMIIKLSELNLL